MVVHINLHGFLTDVPQEQSPTDPGASQTVFQVTTEVLLRDVDTILVDGALILRQKNNLCI